MLVLRYIIKCVQIVVWLLEVYSTRKNPGTTQKCLVVWENIKMVITRLEIKTENEIALVDI